MLWEQLPALLMFLPGETCVGGLVWESYFAQKGREENHLACTWPVGRPRPREELRAKEPPPLPGKHVNDPQQHFGYILVCSLY